MNLCLGLHGKFCLKVNFIAGLYKCADNHQLLPFVCYCIYWPFSHELARILCYSIILEFLSRLFYL